MAVVANSGVELQRLLHESEALSPDVLAGWERLGLGFVAGPHAQVAPEDLAWGTLDLLGADVDGAVVRDTLDRLSSAAGGSQLVLHPRSATLAGLCAKFAAVDAVLARCPQPLPGHAVTRLMSQLDAASEALAGHAAAQLLYPLRWAGSRPEDATLRASLCLPLRILARCVGAEVLSRRELLALARQDVATAVALTVAAVRDPGLPPVPGLQVRLWKILYDISTPQSMAEILGQAGGLATNDRPMEDLLAQHVAFAHGFAAALAQFGALEAVCDCEAGQRGAVLTMCLRTLHSVAASPHLLAAGRILARQVVVLWQRFGFRLLAPHLRRLLNAAGSGGVSALRAARELRHDLRTLGWLLHHAPELRPHAKMLCAEIAMKAAGGHPDETLAVAVGVAANAGALEPGGMLYNTLAAVDPRRKGGVCGSMPPETNRLWVVPEAWQVVEDLGFWPPTPPEAVGLALQPPPLSAFGLLDPGYPEADCEWDDFGGVDWDEVEWGEWQSGEEELVAEGPLGWLGVEAGGCNVGLRTPSARLAGIPEAFRCAIDGRLCVNPMRAPSGLLYERSSIEGWLAWNRVCPVTGSLLSAQELMEDAAVSEAIAAWLDS